MNDNTDKVLKSYFSDKFEPTLETKEILHKKMAESTRRREAKWSSVILLYILLFFALLTLASWTLTSNFVISLTVTVYFLITSVSSTLLTVVCRMQRVKE